MELVNGEDTPKESHKEPVVLVTQKSHSPRGNSDRGLRVSRVTPTSNLFPSSAAAVSTPGEQWLVCQEEGCKGQSYRVSSMAFYILYFLSLFLLPK